MKTKAIILFVMVSTSCLAAAPAPSEVNAVLTKYANNPKGWSALNYAIEANDFKSALILVDYVMDFNRIDDGYSALSRAILHLWKKERLPNKYKLEFIKKLIRKGADLKGHPLTCACQAGNIEIVETMLSTGLNIEFFEGWAFEQAVSFEQIDIIRLLIKKGVNVNKGNPLHHAFFSQRDDGGYKFSTNKYEIIKLLLEAGVDVNDNISPKHQSYLLYAIGNVTLMTLLLEHGADPNGKVPQNRGSSILGVALESLKWSQESGNSLEYEETVQLLLKYGAKLA